MGQKEIRNLAAEIFSPLVQVLLPGRHDNVDGTLRPTARSTEELKAGHATGVPVSMRFERLIHNIVIGRDFLLIAGHHE